MPTGDRVQLPPTEDELRKARLRAQKLAEVKKLADSGQVEEAWNIIEDLMYAEPNDGLVVMMGAYVMHRSKRLSIAYYLARHAVQLAPGQVQTWMEMGHSAKHIWQMEEAKDCFRQALQLTDDPELKAMNYSNISSCFMEEGKFKEAEPIALKALEYNPGHQKARANYGMCLLSRNDLRGWDYYSASLDVPQRTRKRIGTEPDWKGEKDKSLFIYTEQGLGDEINFASMFPDAIKDSDKVVIECDPKLDGLFRRSFGCTVYGTRRTNRSSWDEVDLHPDYSIIAGELGNLYRRKAEDFPGKPYLIADPVRRLMWRAVFDSKKKPCIGIAWSGGTYDTGQKVRKFDLEQLLPIFRSTNAHWVSLQYRDAELEIEAFLKDHPEIDLVQYPWATLTPDYDDTAALVAELDLVVCMQTAVGHLAGALGKEAFIFVPERGLWRYGQDSEKMIWYKSVRLIREKNGWAGPIDKVANALRTRYAAKAA